MKNQSRNSLLNDKKNYKNLRLVMKTTKPEPLVEDDIYKDTMMVGDEFTQFK